MRRYNLGTDSITIDPVNGLIYFDRPTAVVAGTTVITPQNVMAFVAVATGSLNVIVPSPSTYSGTFYTVEGVQHTKTITVRDWSDASNLTNMTTFANEFLSSVENVVVEGSIPYNGLLTAFLVCGSAGQGVNITGNDGVNSFTTGWETLNLPVVSVELVFQSGVEGSSYRTNLQLSNRRGRHTADQFLRPGIYHQQLGGGGASFSGAGMTSLGLADGYTTATQQQQKADTRARRNHAGRPGRGQSAGRRDQRANRPESGEQPGRRNGRRSAAAATTSDRRPAQAGTGPELGSNTP